jgi:hypothetical protein
LGASAVPPIVAASALKLMPPEIKPITGMRTSATSDDTIFPKAPPMITATARSNTLPRLMKAWNSASMPIRDPSL